MCSKDNKENQQKLMFIDIPHQKMYLQDNGVPANEEREKKNQSQ